MLERLEARHAILLVVDMQEKLLPAMHDASGCLRAVRQLLEAAPILGLPVVATEQYPRGLGPTVPEIASLMADGRISEKTLFSACTEQVLAWFREGERRQVIVVGIEAHVCVQQTVLDLLRRGFQAFVCADGVTSRRSLDANIALERMRQGGAVVTTSESVIFELLGQAGTDTFRSILRIVK